MPKLLPPILLVIVVLSMAAVHLGLPTPLLVPVEVRWLGVPVLAAGLALAVAARLQFARAGANLNTFVDPTRLVTGGLFRVSRNPMYLGLSLAALGVAVLCGAATSLLLAAAFVVITDRWYIAFEEKRMAAKFGAAYQTYQESTRRWI